MKVLSFCAYPHSPGRIQTVKIGPILSLCITDATGERYDCRAYDPRTGTVVYEMNDNTLHEQLYLIAIAKITYTRLQEQYKEEEFSLN